MPSGLLDDLQTDIHAACRRLNIGEHAAHAIYLSVAEQLTVRAGSTWVYVPVRDWTRAIDEACEMKRAGSSLAEIARTLGVTRQTVSRWIRQGDA